VLLGRNGCGKSSSDETAAGERIRARKMNKKGDENKVFNRP